MEKRVSNALNYLLWLAVAVVLLYFCFKGVDWKAFWEGLKSCRWEFIAMSMGFGALSFWIRGLRWRELLIPIDSSTKRLTVFNAVNISYIVNMVMPRVGEFVRCGFITRHSARDSQDKPLASYDKVLGTVVMERAWDVVMVILLVLGFLTVGMGRYGEFFVSGILDPISSKISSGGVLLTVIIILVFALLVFLVVKYRHRSGCLSRMASFFEGIKEGLGTCLHMKSGWKFVVLTLMIWMCYWMMSAGIVWAVQGIDVGKVSPVLQGAVANVSGLDMLDALFLMMAGSLSSLIPVPGGFGAFHWVVATSLLTMFGVPWEMGILFATLSHESQIITQAVCGGLSYLSEVFRRR